MGIKNLMTFNGKHYINNRTKLVNFEDYKEERTENLLARHIDTFMPDFELLCDEYAKVCKMLNIPNAVDECLIFSSLNDERLNAHYNSFNIGLKLDESKNIVSTKNNELVLDSKSRNTKMFIRRVCVYKELLENYVRAHNDERSDKYKKYISDIEEGRVPLVITVDNKETNIDLLNWRKYLQPKYYKDLNDYYNVSLISKLEYLYSLDYYDKDNNLCSIFVGDESDKEYLETILQDAIDKTIVKAGYKKTLKKKSK